MESGIFEREWFDEEGLCLFQRKSDHSFKQTDAQLATVPVTPVLTRVPGTTGLVMVSAGSGVVQQLEECLATCLATETQGTAMGMETGRTTVLGDTEVTRGDLEAAGEADHPWVLRSVAVREQELHQVGIFLKMAHICI